MLPLCDAYHLAALYYSVYAELLLFWPAIWLSVINKN